MPGETLPVEPKRVDPPGDQPRSQWGLWLALSLLVIAVLFCVGQLALISPANIQAADTHSGLKADYSLWPPLAFKPLEEALVVELISENPALPTQIVVNGDYWSTPTPPPAEPTPTPSAIPVEPPTAAAGLPAVRPSATRLSRPPNTQPAAAPTTAPSATRAIVTNTQAPSATDRPNTPTPSPTRTSTSTLTSTPTATASPTKTPIRTVKPPATRTYTPTATATTTATATATATATSTATATQIPVFTPKPTITNTPLPTPGPLPNGLNLGPPDNRYYNISCGASLVIDLGDSSTYIGTLIFNEYWNPIPLACKGGVCLDWVTIDLSNSNDPKPTSWPLRIFYWGDQVDTNNGSIPPQYYPPEKHNAAIAGSVLYNQQGIQIHVDGVFRYIRIAPPPDCSDPAQIDSIEIWAATMTPTPVP